MPFLSTPNTVAVTNIRHTTGIMPLLIATKGVESSINEGLAQYYRHPLGSYSS